MATKFSVIREPAAYNSSIIRQKLVGLYKTVKARMQKDTVLKCSGLATERGGEK